MICVPVDRLGCCSQHAGYLEKTHSCGLGCPAPGCGFAATAEADCWPAAASNVVLFSLRLRSKKISGCNPWDRSAHTGLTAAAQHRDLYLLRGFVALALGQPVQLGPGLVGQALELALHRELQARRRRRTPGQAGLGAQRALGVTHFNRRGGGLGMAGPCHPGRRRWTAGSADPGARQARHGSKGAVAWANLRICSLRRGACRARRWRAASGQLAPRALAHSQLFHSCSSPAVAAAVWPSGLHHLAHETCRLTKMALATDN